MSDVKRNDLLPLPSTTRRLISRPSPSTSLTCHIKTFRNMNITEGNRHIQKHVSRCNFFMEVLRISITASADIPEQNGLIQLQKQFLPYLLLFAEREMMLSMACLQKSPPSPHVSLFQLPSQDLLVPKLNVSSGKYEKGNNGPQ